MSIEKLQAALEVMTQARDYWMRAYQECFREKEHLALHIAGRDLLEKRIEALEDRVEVLEATADTQGTDIA